MHRPIWKLCLALALAPVAAHGGEVRVSIRAPCIVPAALAALFPPPPPLPPSPHHLSLQPVEKTVHGGVAIDARTFVSGGIHYRLYGAAAAEPGSADEARARARLQSLLNSGPLKVWPKEIEPSGIRIITLEGNG
jgi:hypothetical protein